MVHHLSFSLAEDVTGWPVAIPYVDGSSLVDLVEAYEVGQAYTDPAGGYGGVKFGSDWVDKEELHLAVWGDPSACDGGTRILSLSCECGEDGCWPLTARARLVGPVLVWDEFAQPHRPSRDYSGFGPFIFNAVQYRVAMAQLRREGRAALLRVERG